MLHFARCEMFYCNLWVCLRAEYIIIIIINIICICSYNVKHEINIEITICVGQQGKISCTKSCPFK